VAGLRPLAGRRRLRTRLGLRQPVDGRRPRVPRTHGRNCQAIFHDAQTTRRTLNVVVLAILIIIIRPALHVRRRFLAYPPPTLRHARFHETFSTRFVDVIAYIIISLPFIILISYVFKLF